MSSENVYVRDVVFGTAATRPLRPLVTTPAPASTVKFASALNTIRLKLTAVSTTAVAPPSANVAVV